jgi:hypothetical protein
MSKENKINFSTPPQGEYISANDVEEAKARMLLWKAAKEAATQPITLEKVAEILSKTIKHDKNLKLRLFLCMILTYTQSDQQNWMFNSPSSTGKSFIALEVGKLFPKEDIDKKGYCSPTAYFHEHGKLHTIDGEPLEDRSAYINTKLELWEKEHPRPYAADSIDKTPEAIKSRKALSQWKDSRKTEYRKQKDAWDAFDKIYVVNLEKRIEIFKDAPHDRVLQVLRSLLSHDEKILEADITDTTKEGGHRTKKVRVIGFPTMIFCSTAFSLDDQEKTRFWVESPNMGQKKIEASLDQQVKSLGNRSVFQAKLDADADRAALKERIEAIKASNVKEIIIPNKDMEDLLTWFKRGERTLERGLSPRDMRDFPKLVALAKGHALFQLFERERAPDGDVIAKPEDLEAVKGLFDEVIRANRLGLPPYIYDFNNEDIQPVLTEVGISPEDLSRLYFQRFNTRIGEKARKRLIDLLSEAGLVETRPDPDDRRKTRIYIPFEGVEKKQKNGKPEKVAPKPSKGTLDRFTLQENLERVLGIFREYPDEILGEDLILSLLEDPLKIPREEGRQLLKILFQDGSIFEPRPGFYKLSGGG